MNDQSNQNTQTNWKVSILVPIIIAIIGGISTIIASVAGNDAGEEKAVSELINQATNTVNVNINSIDELITMYSQLSTEISNLKDENLKLEKENNSLNIENESLKRENKSLKNEYEKYSSSTEDTTALLEKNKSLEDEITELRSEIQTLKNNNSENGIQDGSDSSSIQTGNKVSIFDMDTFRGDGNWEIPASKGDYTDTYGNEYAQAHVTFHYPTSKDDLSLVPTYLLNHKYSICEGQIVWAKSEKNESGSVWIEFYSDNNLIYSTDHITATDKIITFSFSVEDLETLTIVKNTNRGSYLSSVTIIYPYFNLIE